MGLTERQINEMYKSTLETRVDIRWIKEHLEDCDDKLFHISRRQNGIEQENALLKGKLGAFVIVLSLCATLLFNGLGFVLANFWRT